MKAQQKYKVLIIGLEGATFRVIDPLLQREELSYLARMMAE